MAEYIKREDAQKVVCWVCGVCQNPSLKDLMVCEVCTRFAKIPSADVEERQTGKWVLKTFDDGYGEYQLYECNQCGAVTAQSKSKNYCHNCGAKMESEGEDG